MEGSAATPNTTRSLLVESERTVISEATVKVLILDETPDDEKFLFVAERESEFVRMTPRGETETMTKRRGKGFPGGRVETREFELAWAQEMGIKSTDHRWIAAVREVEEETGIPRDIIAARMTDKTWTRYSGWEKHPWILYFARGEGIQNHVNRRNIQDLKLERIHKWDRIGWARIRNLRDTILLPLNARERARRLAGGDATFYTGHLVALLAMLIKIEREDLFEVAYRDLSFHMMFSRPMLEMLIAKGRKESFLDRLKSSTYNPDLQAARRVVRHFVGLGLEEYLEILLTKVSDDVGNKLKAYSEEQLTQRELLGDLYTQAAEAEGMKEEGEEATGQEPDAPQEDLSPLHEDPFLAEALRAARKSV